MKRKLLVLSCLILLIPSVLLLNGCLERRISSEIGSIYRNSSPIAIIQAPKNAYFRDQIYFDASKSYDIDGTINSYAWDFGDNRTSKGVNVSHAYEFEDYYNMDFPITYVVILKIVDNNQSWEYLTHEILLYPKNYTFYFTRDSLVLEKPVSGQKSIRPSLGLRNLRSSNDYVFELSEHIPIPKSIWDISLFIKKPKLALFRSLSVTLVNSAGQTISQEEQLFSPFDFWEERVITLSGKSIQKENFHSVKLSVYGFSWAENVQILYGDSKSSALTFSFTIP